MSRKGGVGGDLAADEDLRRLVAKHASLQLDYNELQRETRAFKKRLQRTKLKKDKLLAEVRFLRRRHRLLTKKSSQALPQKQPLVGSKVMGPPKHVQYDHAVNPKQSLPAQHMAAKYEYANRGTSSEQQISAKNRGASYEEPVAPHTLRNKHFTMFDCITPENNPPAAREFQVFWEPLREETSSYVAAPIRKLIENVGLASDLNLSMFKDIPNGFVLSNKTGKRSISWQDQMVLKV
ncbi:hypothetical protein SUGI_0995950 [Cryptomeria japonica]|uniref:uncharacterized protein LOC131060659 n=1 Tax=Cryptomeria japonica TaxID=3369 RepID=UPI0024148EB1|nr:uncharacterized protein LOC131060659 [Cryptomeria japonica]GLJ47179.1 hypothetical protein SUGI_0995950 [Cryptomeria japonica]